MPRLTSELVQDAFASLMERGFSEPEWWLAGTDQMVTVRRDGVEVHVESADMGTNLPNAYLRQPGGSMFSLVDDSEYPAFTKRFLLWMPWYGRGRLETEIQREFDTRVRRLAALAEAHIAKLA